MARSAIYVLALMVAGGLALPEPVPSQVEQHQPVVVSHEDLELQKKLMVLFSRPHEPLVIPEYQKIAQTWELTKNIDKYSNATAVHMSEKLIQGKFVHPIGVPFSILEPHHKFVAATFFNLLFSAKTVDTFFKTAVYLRAHINEYLFVYVTTVAIYHRQDTQGIVVPPIYEIFPSFFNNGEIMTTAQRINTHGTYAVEHYPSTYIWDNNVVIRKNATVWPYYSKELPLTYFTHDFGLSSYYYNLHVLYPSWLGGETVPLIKDRPGEWFWFIHRQILARYYMERLSNGLGEIPELGLNVVEEGYNSGLLYHNGIPHPVRPNYFLLEQPQFVDKIKQITDFERRIRDAVDLGYYINPTGEHVDIRTPEAIDVLGRLVESSIDSPNNHYYKDFISIWKSLLGNSETHPTLYWKGIPLVVPSPLEQYQTTLRDPAFYMIWKRVMKIFTQWHKNLPLYKPEEIGMTGVEIQKVEVDKLVTYFEHTYLNVTNHLHMNEYERQHLTETKSVVVEHNRLNHKVFSVRVHVKSEAPKNVVVRLFLGPKYDSTGKELPLEINYQNFLEIDQFIYNMKQGDNVISRSSNDIPYLVKDYTSAFKLYGNVVKALEGHEQFTYTMEKPDGIPQRALLPKGRVGGMPFVILVHISEYHAPNVLYGTGYNTNLSVGVGSGARRLTSDPLGFPLDRPLYQWQLSDLKNVWLEDVNIYHKHTPEIYVDHME